MQEQYAGVRRGIGQDDCYASDSWNGVPVQLAIVWMIDYTETAESIPHDWRDQQSQQEGNGG